MNQLHTSEKEIFNYSNQELMLPDFFAINTIVHQVKAWLRSVYSYMNEAHIEKYLDEFSFRINRSIHRQTIFHTVIKRLMKSEHIGYKQIKISN